MDEEAQYCCCRDSYRRLENRTSTNERVSEEGILSHERGKHEGVCMYNPCPHAEHTTHVSSGSSPDSIFTGVYACMTS
jgi:hypothetical protein